MAASAGTLVCVGASGKTYTVDLYVPDAVATTIRFNPAGLATSSGSEYWKAPEACVIVDISIAAAPTAVGASILKSNAVFTGNTIRWANQLSTLATRMKLKIPVPAGEQVGMLQF